MTDLLKKAAVNVCCLLIALYAISSPALAAVRWPDNISVQAEAAIVMDADTGTVLWGQNIHNQYFPASITKIMTALLVIENCDLDEMVTFSHNAVYNVEAGSSNAGISEGDVLSVKDCLYALLLKSANESANALAEHVSGSTEAFASLMNAKAKELGCLDTHFANPSGLNNPEHYTSAYDMALIAKAAFANPIFREIDSTTYYKLPPNAVSPEGLKIYPGHKMLKKNTPYYYPGIVGGKTGYTTLAGNTLVTCAEKNGMRLIAVILKGSTPQYWTDTKRLLDFGFTEFVSLKAADYESGYTSLSEDLKISGLTIEKPTALVLDPESRVTLPKAAEFKDATSELSYDISPNDPPNAIAKILYRYDDRLVGCTYVEINEALFSAASSKAAASPVNSASGTASGNKAAFTAKTGDAKDFSAGAGGGSESTSETSAGGGASAEAADGAASTAAVPAAESNSAFGETPSEDYREKALRPFVIPAIAWKVLIGFVLTVILLCVIAVPIFHRRNRRADSLLRHERRMTRLEESGLSAEEFNALLEQKRSTYTSKHKQKKRRNRHLKFR